MFSFLRSKYRLEITISGLTWWNGLHDLLGLVLVVDLQGKEVLWSSKLELGGVSSLVLLDGDSVSVWEVLLLSPHDSNEFLQVLDFFWL